MKLGKETEKLIDDLTDIIMKVDEEYSDASQMKRCHMISCAVVKSLEEKK